MPLDVNYIRRSLTFRFLRGVLLTTAPGSNGQRLAEVPTPRTSGESAGPKSGSTLSGPLRFFTATIRSRNTRMEYARGKRGFSTD